jgi:hypothetical protein
MTLRSRETLAAVGYYMAWISKLSGFFRIAGANFIRTFLRGVASCSGTGF